VRSSWEDPLNHSYSTVISAGAPQQQVLKQRGCRLRTQGVIPFQPSLLRPSLETGGYEGHPEQKEKQR